MKHVVALDVSKGKSIVAIYDGYRQCEFEGELNHTRVDFERLHKRMEDIKLLDGQAPDIVFEATGVYSKPVEAFFKDYGYAYCRMNPLEANLQMAKIHRILVMHMNLRKPISKWNVKIHTSKMIIMNRCAP